MVPPLLGEFERTYSVFEKEGTYPCPKGRTRRTGDSWKQDTT